MRLTRRSMLGACAGAVAGPGARRRLDASGGHGSLGLVIHSFPVRTAGDRGRPSRGSVLGRRPDSSTMPARSAPAVFRSASGSCDDAAADALRERARAASMYLEGIVSLPRDQADLERFEAEIRTAKRAGAAGRADRDALGTAVRDVRHRRRVPPVRRIVAPTP